MDGVSNIMFKVLILKNYYRKPLNMFYVWKWFKLSMEVQQNLLIKN